MINSNYIYKIKQYCIDNNLWNIPEDEAGFLYDLILKKKYIRILEYGTSGGYSTLWLASAAFQNDNKDYVVDTIESNKIRFDIASNHFKNSGLKINIHLGHCPECLDGFITLEKKYDFIFMDIVKKHYTESFKKSLELLDKNGMIVADNINTHKNETKDFIDFISNIKNMETEIAVVGNGISISRFKV
ncbi:class I SAM-dependent methyltransferase [Candidatus Dependentiae bacterium]|nr:class I SAM-dependent methyltransferase [Candidatus Dependentiae bacterium]